MRATKLPMAFTLFNMNFQVDGCIPANDRFWYVRVRVCACVRVCGHAANTTCRKQGLQRKSAIVSMCHSGAIWRHKIWDNIDSGNGLMPDGTKPLPEPKVTKDYLRLFHCNFAEKGTRCARKNIIHTYLLKKFYASNSILFKLSLHPQGTMSRCMIQ